MRLALGYIVETVEQTINLISAIIKSLQISIKNEQSRHFLFRYRCNGNVGEGGGDFWKTECMVKVLQNNLINL